MTFKNHTGLLRSTALICVALIAPGGIPLVAQEQKPAAADEKPKLKSGDQLDSLVAPIALYPDPLLAQCLVAATYPIDVVAAQQWLAKNTSLKGEALEKQAQQQPWDPSVQALVSLPEALKTLSENIK